LSAEYLSESRKTTPVKTLQGFLDAEKPGQMQPQGKLKHKELQFQLPVWMTVEQETYRSAKVQYTL
jgi:hypothetical protein